LRWRSCCRDDLLDGAKLGDDNAFEILLQPLLEPGLASAQLTGDQDGFNAGRALLTQRFLAIDAYLVGVDTHSSNPRGNLWSSETKGRGCRPRSSVLRHGSEHGDRVA